MRLLVIQLPPTPLAAGSELTREFAFVQSVDGRTADRVSCAPAHQLPATTGAGSENIAVVPATALSWHRVEWPRGIRATSLRLRAALEGLLEEHLLDEPEMMHFTVEPGARAGALTWVAVCDRQWLRSYLTALEAHGLAITRIVPEVAPESPAALYVMRAQDLEVIVARSPRGVMTLPLAPESLPLMPAWPDDALCFVEPAMTAQAERLLQRPLVLQTAAERWLQAAQSPWNLAQFDLAQTGRARAIQRLARSASQWMYAPQWRPVRWGAALLVMVNLIGLNAWAWVERAAIDRQRAQVRQILTATFPQVAVVVDAPLQMAREVAALRQATATPGHDDLETLLGALAGAVPDRTVTGLDYARSTLRIQGLGWTAADLASAQPALRAQGLSATLQGSDLVMRAQERP